MQLLLFNTARLCSVHRMADMVTAPNAVITSGSSWRMDTHLYPLFHITGVRTAAAELFRSFAPLQIAVAKQIVAQDGFGALYKGLSAGLLRQATYTTARLGIYQVFSDSLIKYNDGQVLHVC